MNQKSKLSELQRYAEFKCWNLESIVKYPLPHSTAVAKQLVPAPINKSY